MPEKLCWKLRISPSFVLKIFIHTGYFMASVVLVFHSVTFQNFHFEMDPVWAGDEKQCVNWRRHVDDIVVAGQAEITAAQVKIASY